MTISRKFYNFLKWLLIIVAVFLVFIALAIALYLFYDHGNEGVYFPGTRIAGIDVGRMSKEGAEKKIIEKTDLIHAGGIIFIYHNEKATLKTLYTSAGADIAYPIVMFEIQDALERAYDYSRTDSLIYNIFERYGLWKHGKDFPIQVNTKNQEIHDFFDNNFSRFSTPAKDATLVFETDRSGTNYKFEVEEEIYGQAIDYDKALQELREKLSRLDNSPIILEAKIEYPKTYKKDAFDIDTRANELLALAPIELYYEDDSWKIEKKELAELLTLKSFNNENGDAEAYVGIAKEKAELYLSESIRSEIDIEAVDAKFEIVESKVEQFQGSQDGRKLNTGLSYERLEESLLVNASTSVELAVDMVVSKKTTEEMENLGIAEILGTGHSSFAGSPKNRRHNIAVGANSVNGTLLAPGEEFSLLKVLGDIDAKTGYLPELVIKGNRTVPEYGGGLCQIGTTVFRGTVNSGLPVTMRRNHSYRVSYYEPAGTDATIYDPWPDYRFSNDTPSHVLIQSRIEGDDLYFDFWGTKDGRIASSTDPVIYNIRYPAPAKMIETLDLAPGVKKCSESAHNGADAYFDYSIQYPDGELHEERFKSHYVPWQAVCLIGVEQLSSEKEKNASSTEALVE